MGIPKKDAKILAGVVKRAQFLEEGFSLLGKKVGVNTVIECFPEAGDIISTGLSFALVVLPACRVSKGDGKNKFMSVVLWRLFGGFFVGLVPYLSVLIYSRRKMNVKNGDALEAMLLKRVDKASKPGRDIENGARSIKHQHTTTIGNHAAPTSRRHDPEPPTHATTNGSRAAPTRRRHDPEPPAHATTNGHRAAPTSRRHDPEPPAHEPPRYITAKDILQDPGPRATQTQSKQSSRSFFRRRGEAQGHEAAAGTPMEELAPVRPARPQHSVPERSGHF
ncbi:hypothetical protein BDR22DRAFT_202569 [Usnea florida]